MANAPLPAGYFRPPADAGWLARLSWRLLRVAGWRVVLREPIPAKCVAILYPHTSNWDFVVGLFTRWALRFTARWAAKDTLFDTPLRPFFLRIGGVPVNRRERTGFAEAMRAQFERNEEFQLVITPEGTRSYVLHWKSGFYHIARVARVPLALAFIDYPRREIGFLGNLELTGDPAVDMAAIATAYAGKVGKNPDQQGPIALRQDGGTG